MTLDNAKFKNAIFTGATLTHSQFFGGNITGADSDTFIVCDRATGQIPLQLLATRDLGGK